MNQRTDIAPGGKGYFWSEYTVTYSYDGAGNLSGKQEVSQSNWGNSRHQEEYDSKGNVTRRITQSLDKDGNITSESEIVFQNSYDKDGNLLSITNTKNGSTTEYTYGYIYIPK